jgi:nitrogen fixation/metabolism regulation signal transduction histidine kinase
MGEAATAPTVGSGRHQRRLRNLLLDRHFQLKYSGYLVGTAIVLSLALGTILWRTSEAVITQSLEAVEQGENVVSLGREVVSESRKVSAVVQMNIVRDPVYSDNAGLLEAFKTDAAKQDERLKRQQQQLEGQAAGLKAYSSRLASQQRTMLLSLCLALGVLVLGVGFAGIVVTHKVAGPVYKMKRQIRDVGEGKLTIPGSLRKGDELVDFFDAFDHMVRSLRARQENEIALLDAAIQKLQAERGPEALKPLNELRSHMQSALDS